MAQVQGAPAGVQNRPIPFGPFNPNKTHSEPERWICIYPAYLNALKTRREGRIVPKANAIENPSLSHLICISSINPFTFLHFNQGPFHVQIAISNLCHKLYFMNYTLRFTLRGFEIREKNTIPF